jgi:hypothetical protein
VTFSILEKREFGLYTLLTKYLLTLFIILREDGEKINF